MTAIQLIRTHKGALPGKTVLKAMGDDDKRRIERLGYYSAEVFDHERLRELIDAATLAGWAVLIRTDLDVEA